ncbi:NlpC/P60 family protein [Halocynthiibacter namhaensis]|uniref:C40 family peptidase n=1 Tax=Halocynthiibacter namhaensis TaxID=1290553 RepID=UPI0009DD443A|nr:NlpC/P60 family protein [Halocynthiibacter namhaensis]
MDRRITPATPRVAASELRDQVTSNRFSKGTFMHVCVPVTDLLAAPDGPRDRQLLLGQSMRVFETHAGFSYIQSQRDGYCGYVSEMALGPVAASTHWVTAPATHLYAEADFKSQDMGLLSLGAELCVTETQGRFARTQMGSWVPQQHIEPIDFRFDDPASVAQTLIGTPYLWGGNSRSGLDCSALVQIAFHACGREIPGDSDLQERGLAPGLPMGDIPKRNDLMFWKGHVALVLSEDRLIHANAGAMAVAIEGINAAIRRIEDQGDGPVTSRVRL